MEQKPKVIDERRFKLEDLFRKGFIPMFTGRPNREEVITKDELINLTISLNVAHSTEEFLKSI